MMIKAFCNDALFCQFKSVFILNIFTYKIYQELTRFFLPSIKLKWFKVKYYSLVVKV